MFAVILDFNDLDLVIVGVTMDTTCARNELKKDVVDK